MLIEMFLLLTKLKHVACSYKYRLSEVLTQNPLQRKEGYEVYLDRLGRTQQVMCWSYGSLEAASIMHQTWWCLGQFRLSKK